MHELISTTWEQFLYECYGNVKSTGDNLLDLTVTASHRINKPVSLLLREYGRFTLIHYLYPHFQSLCTQDLLIAIRKAHSQLRRTTSVPAIFREEPP